MFRTLVIFSRNDIVKQNIRQRLRIQIARGLCSESIRKRHQQRTLTHYNNIEQRPLLIWNQCSVRYYADYPSHTPVPLPALSPTMETGTIVNWAKKEGDKLNEGDLLAEIETDKATMGFETPEEGYLAKILVPAGEKNIPVGQLVCVIVTEQGDVAAFKNYEASAAPKTELKKAAPEQAPSAAPAQAPSQPSATPPPPLPTNWPSHTPVTLPALSPTMETGNIASWAKKVGDKLNEGDLLAEIETDKATMGFETPEEGYLAKILVPAGEKNVPIGKLVCIIVPEKGDVDAFQNYVESTTPAVKITGTKPVETVPVTFTGSESIKPTGGGERVYASPMARRLAEIRKVRLEGKGSGIFGSFKSKDVPAEGVAAKAGVKADAAGVSEQPPSKAKPEAPKPGARFIDIPITNMRNVIAKRLLESKTTVPHYYLSQEINVEQLMKFRNEMNKQLEKEKIKLSINDFIIKAVAATTTRVPEVNSAWLGDVIRQYLQVDVSVAVSTDVGLITPIIFDADRKGVIEISRNMRELAKKARDNKLQPSEFQGGTICVSNLGMFDLSFFSAIINPPQSAILAVGGTVMRVVSDGQGGFKEAPHIIVTLSCDHRVIDGALGAKWMKVLKQNLSNPAAICL